MPHNLYDLCKYRYEQGKEIENAEKFVKEIKRYLENTYNISL
ncbi:MAG: hypothetical protein NT166_23660 [Candidatus Aminicenantes bacterium]|nr:hypothetical protein [Candidatus Aminicenantes bacterium]